MTWQDYPDNRGPGRPPKYPLRKIAVGESFFVAGGDVNKICKRAWVMKPLRFKSRTVVSGGVKGVRVWRIA